MDNLELLIDSNREIPAPYICIRYNRLQTKNYDRVNFIEVGDRKIHQLLDYNKQDFPVLIVN